MNTAEFKNMKAGMVVKSKRSIIKTFVCVTEGKVLLADDDNFKLVIAKAPLPKSTKFSELSPAEFMGEWNCTNYIFGKQML